MKHIATITRFFSEVKAELLKVEWPKFDDFVGSVIIVLVTMLFFALFLGIVDKMIFIAIKQVFILAGIA